MELSTGTHFVKYQWSAEVPFFAGILMLDHVWMPDFQNSWLTPSSSGSNPVLSLSVLHFLFKKPFCWLNPHCSPFFLVAPTFCSLQDRRRHGHSHLPTGGDIWRWHRRGLQSADAAGIYAVRWRGTEARWPSGNSNNKHGFSWVYIYIHIHSMCIYI